MRQACAVTAGAAVGLSDRQDGPSLRQADTARDVWHIAPLPRFQTATGCHTFRATGITHYLTNGGRIEVAQRMAGHSNAKPLGFTTGATMTSA